MCRRFLQRSTVIQEKGEDYVYCHEQGFYGHCCRYNKGLYTLHGMTETRLYEKYMFTSYRSIMLLICYKTHALGHRVRIQERTGSHLSEHHQDFLCVVLSTDAADRPSDSACT